MMMLVTAIALSVNPASIGLASTRVDCSGPVGVNDRFAAKILVRHDQPQTVSEEQLMPPRTVASLTEKLAKTGGVLTPPAGGKLIVIQPPTTGRNSMETMPEIAPRSEHHARVPAGERP